MGVDVAFCGDCHAVDPPEDHPLTKGHICEIYGERIIHGDFHPEILRCIKCVENKTKEILNVAKRGGYK